MSLETIHQNAQLVLDRLRDLSGLGSDFGYNRKSLEWVEGYIERLRTSEKFAAPNQHSSLIQVFGAYLGECVIHTYGGSWKQQEGRWGVFFDDSNAVFPFAKVHKLFQGGLESGESIVGFFDLIEPVIFKRNLGI